jgi:Thioredoxin-like domain
LVAVKLNAEREGKALARKYSVRGFPTVLYLDAEGNEWGRMPGFMPAAGFIQLGREALSTYREQPLLEAKLKQNPSNTALAADLVNRFARQGNEKKALWAAGLLTKGPQTSKCAAAYGALGTYYVKNESATKARTWLNKSLAVATEASDKAYAHFGLAFCFIGERNAKGARAELNAAVKVPGCPEELRENAQKLLEQIPK